MRWHEIGDAEWTRTEPLPPERCRRSVWARGFGRSRGGFGTRLHFATDRAGRPLRIVVTGGARNDAAEAEELLAGLAPGLSPGL